jgi:peptidoglycan/LPS O-acetylase OafA/YrhL
LAVEEQFYLLWPLLVFLLPKRALQPVLIGALGLGFCYRAAIQAAGVSGFARTHAAVIA